MYLETELGPMAVIMVGAAMVGSIGTVWDGTVVRRSGIEVKNYADKDLRYKRGDEIGQLQVRLYRYYFMASTRRRSSHINHLRCRCEDGSAYDR